MMWPELLDMTREESKRILRRVELEAYSSVVSAFRAQGDLTKEKKRLLHDLQNILRYMYIVYCKLISFELDTLQWEITLIWKYLLL